MQIIVGLSGGVDSSVAALLLKDEGHDVTGVMMRRWREGRYAGGGRDACFGAGEADSVRAAEAFCRRFGLPFRTFDCGEAFEQEVVANFRTEYLAGRTPNPCVRCNALLKFGLLPELARASGLACGAFATGHYARIDQAGDATGCCAPAKPPAINPTSSTASRRSSCGVSSSRWAA